MKKDESPDARVVLEELKELHAFAEDFGEPSDRAMVVLSAARLDLALYHVLQRYLLPPPSGDDELLDNDGALGTFHSRITAAYRLGLVDAGFARALHLVRKIRNEFAHELTTSSLNSGSHKHRVRELVAPLKEFVPFTNFRSQYFNSKPGFDGDFRAVVAYLSLRLRGVVERCKTVGSAAAVSLTYIPTKEELELDPPASAPAK